KTGQHDRCAPSKRSSNGSTRALPLARATSPARPLRRRRGKRWRARAPDLPAIVSARYALRGKHPHAAKRRGGAEALEVRKSRRPLAKRRPSAVNRQPCRFTVHSTTDLFTNPATASG